MLRKLAAILFFVTAAVLAVPGKAAKPGTWNAHYCPCLNNCYPPTCDCEIVFVRG